MVGPEGAPDSQIKAAEIFEMCDFFSAPAVYQRRDALGQRPFLNGCGLDCIALLPMNDLLLY